MYNNNNNTMWILAMSVTAIAIGALVFVGSGLSAGIAQISDSSSDKSWSGTLNSVVEDASNEKQIVGGEWSLSLDGNNVTEFSADFDMVSSDGTGAHTHRIVISDEGATQTASTEDLEVTLVPTEQSAGGSVLVNVTGLAAGSNVTVKLDDNITGLTESDEDGNLLYALGITESMEGSSIVSVEDGEGNSGSATLTVTEAQEVGSRNTSTNNNLTGTSINNATTSANGTISSESGDNDAGITSEIQNNTAGTDFSSNQTSYNTIETEIQSPTYGSENTTLSTPIISNDTTTSPATGSYFTSYPGPNATSATSSESLTSVKAESSVVAEIAGNTTTFTTKAAIYLNDEPKWEDVDITVSLVNGKVLTIEIDPEATDDHFGQEPIYGIVTLAGDSYR